VEAIATTTILLSANTRVLKVCPFSLQYITLCHRNIIRDIFKSNSWFLGYEGLNPRDSCVTMTKADRDHFFTIESCIDSAYYVCEAGNGSNSL